MALATTFLLSNFWTVPNAVAVDPDPQVVVQRELDVRASRVQPRERIIGFMRQVHQAREPSDLRQAAVEYGLDPESIVSLLTSSGHDNQNPDPISVLRTAADNLLRDKYYPEALAEARTEKLKPEDRRDEPERPILPYAGPFNAQAGQPTSSNGSSQSSAGKGSGEASAGAPTLTALAGGNPLELLRSKEANVIQPESARELEGANGFGDVEVNDKRPNISIPNRSSAETSASPIVKKLQMLLGKSEVPGSLQAPKGPSFDSLSPEAPAEKPIGIAKASANAAGGLGEPSVSPNDTRQDGRNDFSARAPDMAPGTDDEETVSTNSAANDSDAPITNRQILRLGPPDEKGRQWIFSYAAWKMIRKSCDLSNTLIREFCTGLSRRRPPPTIMVDPLVTAAKMP